MKILIDGQTLSTPEASRGIGTYFVNNLYHMIRSGYMSQITLATFDDYDRSAIASISSNISVVSLGKRLDFSPGSGDEYNRRLCDLVKTLDIDILWIPNYLMLNVHSLGVKPQCKTVVTVHDLIPLVFKDAIMKKIWSENARQSYLRKLSDLARVSDHLIAVSESTGHDLVELQGIRPEIVTTIHEGYKRTSQVLLPYEKIKNQYGVKDYILYIGGFDPRKNMEGSVLAFKRLVESRSLENLSYLITCGYDEGSKREFSNLLKKHALEDKVRLTGYVSDIELLSLIKYSKVFFFPSLYEGFGLPLLEAMALGVPVAASRTSSIPEVVGDAGILFDPGDIDDMAAALYQILSDETLSIRLGQDGVNAAGRFSWKKSALETLELFEKIHVEAIHGLIAGRSLRVAYFSPVSPQKSGISVYSETLLPILAKYVKVDLFLDTGVEPSSDLIRGNIPYYNYRQFSELNRSENYDAIIYNMGNNTLHEYIYRMLIQYPGITILHDYVLHPFIQHITALAGNEKAYLQELISTYGLSGQKMADDYARGMQGTVDFMKYPLNERVVASSRMVVAHSHFIRGMLSGKDNVKVVLQGHDPAHAAGDDMQTVRQELNLSDRSPVIGCFGFMNHNKRIDVLVEAFGKIAGSNPESVLLLVGDIDARYKKEITGLIKKWGIEDNVVIVGYATEAMYEKYLLCTDIVVNLRYPTMGETSATLLDALAHGKPVIVSNTGSYAEFPDWCCWKVDVDSTEGEVLYAYLDELVRNSKLRDAMGTNARKYIARNHRWELIVLDFVKLIASCR